MLLLATLIILIYEFYEMAKSFSKFLPRSCMSDDKVSEFISM